MYRLAYLTSQYPAASHTFIQREIEGLRALGWEIETFSVREAASGEVSGARDRSEHDHTYYLLSQPLIVFAVAQLRALIGHPVRYFSCLMLSLSHRPPGMRGFLLACAHFVESITLALELRRRGVVHLHNHFANSAATVGLIACRFLRIRWSFTVHGISETDYPAGLLLGKKVQAATFVASASWFFRAQALRLVQRDQWDKVEVIRCGLPLHRLPARVADRSGTIVCVGRLSPEKAQAGLLQAFAQLHRKRPDLELRFVGDGPDRHLLERLARELNIATRVTFCGRLTEEDTLAEIAAADVLALPSFMEGLPIVLMEAMALGVPVVASRVAGIPELVTSGLNGMLFDPSDWAALMDAIDLLLSRDALYESCAQKSAEFKL
jgi:glycosyltransferase involved in cell wall biosynthesis